MLKFLGRLVAFLGCLGVAVAVNAQDKMDFDYKLGPGDIIRIVVFQNPDLTLDTRVSESGAITYPLIGAVQIGGMSIEAAEKQIAKGLKSGGFVQQPQVNIALTQVRGNQVSVLGLVNRPGRFPLETSNTRLSDLLAMAGGVAQSGSDIVVITGIREGKSFRKEVDFPAIYLGDRSSEDIVVAGGDVVYVHRAPSYYIYGEAQRPGSYRIERGMTIQQAMAQGGGTTLRGMEYWIRLHRKNAEGKIESFTPDKHDLVQADDVIYIRESFF